MFRFLKIAALCFSGSRRAGQVAQGAGSLALPAAVFAAWDDIHAAPPDNLLQEYYARVSREYSA